MSNCFHPYEHYIALGRDVVMVAQWFIRSPIKLGAQPQHTNQTGAGSPWLLEAYTEWLEHNIQASRVCVRHQHFLWLWRTPFFVFLNRTIKSYAFIYFILRRRQNQFRSVSPRFTDHFRVVFTATEAIITIMALDRTFLLDFIISDHSWRLPY